MESFLEAKDGAKDHDDLYPIDLEEYVASCLYRNPAQRVDHQTLLDAVRRGRQDCSDQLNDGKYSTCTENGMHPWHRVRFVEDDFAVGYS